MEPKKTFIKTLGISLALIAVLFGGIWYVKSDIGNKIVLVEQARADIHSKEQALTALASLQKDSEQAKQYLPQIDQRLTSKDRLLGFSADVSFLAQQAGFSGTPKFREDTSAPVGDLQRTNFSLLLDGSKDLDAVGTFFRSVERSNYFVRFANMDVTRDGKTLRVQTDGYVISFQPTL